MIYLIGTTHLVEGLNSAFIEGIDSALSFSIIIIAIAGTMSWMRGTKKEGKIYRNIELWVHYTRSD